MQIIVEPSTINGKINAPASKSLVQRALAAALLSSGKTTISGYTESDDALAALGIIKTLGAETCFDNELIVSGNPPLRKREKLTLSSGESGLSSRLFAPLSLLYSNDVQINGKGSLLNRPFGDLMKSVFEQMNIEYSDNEGKLPVNLRGELKANHILIDGSGGSQFVSGILMTLPLLANDSIVEVENLKSKPYIDLTLSVLSKFGIHMKHEHHEIFRIKSGQKYQSTNLGIEGDWSGISCLLVAGAIAGNLEITNLNYHTNQADRRIIDALRLTGAIVNIKPSSVVIFRTKLRSFDFDATDSPDLFPALVALAANCVGVSRIRGVTRLLTKESNRAETLKSEYGKAGIDITLDGDYMLVMGQQVRGVTIDSHNDHRIAMSLAVAGLNAKSAMTIENADCVNKSYPDFWKDLFKIQVKN
ncbi:MAG: 3-phosphoshikimate 1-carboxyvinyltransferase [Prevotellaceae bacterium]|jgi:3-phosphoshikimate 1-carboxyvinyltransferase|nr:3-phosphoshikimate 1-carboxyvinyltransferase [Prevotellaceae bacterium]